jgi:hypothetical protein
MAPFYSEPKPVPATLRTVDLYLEMLAPEHVDRDYEAFMSSWPRLQIWSGTDRWPRPDFTREENLQDLTEHRDEFLQREAFAYTVLNSDKTRCEGCVYINPWSMTRELHPKSAPVDLPDDAAIVTYWVRESALERDLDRQLLDALIEWFSGDEWAFDRVLFLVNMNQQRDIEQLEDAGLERTVTLVSERSPGRYFFYDVA